jgi:transcriptional regulator with XRE-family HTH domain
MEAATVLRRARRRSRLTLRELAGRAGTSHATLSAYEAGRKVPTVATLDRIVRAAGVGGGGGGSARGRPRPPAVGGVDRAARGQELIDVLELASMFPARHEPELSFPRFGRP